MRFAFVKCHGSGNDFPLIDARALALADDQWAVVARALADRAGPVGGDGLLALVPGDDDHAFGMRMWNSDGSEAETCLNGLRCTARLGFELLGAEKAAVKLKTSEADVAQVAPLAPGVTTVRTRVAVAGLGAEAIGMTGPLTALPSGRRFTAVAMPNPHLVAFVDTIDEGELVTLGTWCEGAPELVPQRANVSFVEVRRGGLFVRTFERGVGLTDSCGSAMAASVFAAAEAGHVPFGAEVTVFNKGGLVRGQADRDGVEAAVTIAGNATFLYDASVEVDLDRGTAGMPLIHARREDEARAWDAAVAALAG